MSKQDIADYVFKTPHNTNPAILNQKLDELVEESSSGVQPDWNQNDETAPDYIKNRPGGYSTVIPPVTIEWDGNTDGKTIVSAGDSTYCLVSTDTLEPEQLIGATVTVINAGKEQQATITEDMINIRDTYLGTVSFLVILSQCTINGVTFDVPGVYFLKISDDTYVSKLQTVQTVGDDAKIPAKYLDAVQSYVLTLGYNGETDSYYLDGFEWEKFKEAVKSENTLILLKGLNGKNTCAPCTPLWNRNNYTLFCGTALLSVGSNGLQHYNPVYFANTNIKESIILKSSTLASTKEFKITVDDTGTLTATAITK